MFIAFEGPDKTGKSTSAATLAHDGVAVYNATKAIHEDLRALHVEPDLPITYDRIDWLTHMVYRLAMPDRDWNDDRPRTVFAMPDTHLVLKLHHPVMVDLIEDELYEAGRLAPVNELYYHQVMWLVGMSRVRGWDWFRSISIVEVSNDPRDGSFSQKLAFHENAAHSEHYYTKALERAVTADTDLLEFLREQERHLL